MSMTAGTSENPFRQGHLLPMSTLTAGLTRIGRIDFDSSSASFFRFAEQLLKKPSPRGVSNAFGKTVVVNHAVDLQVFHTDHAETINDLTACLMGEVVTSEGDPLMHTGHRFAMLASLSCALCQLTVLALYTGQSFLFFAKEARVSDLFPGGERSERLESHVYAHLGRSLRQALRLALYRKADVPLARRGTVDGTPF